MLSNNDITGDSIANIKGDAEAYAKGWDAIWGEAEDVANEDCLCDDVEDEEHTGSKD